MKNNKLLALLLCSGIVLSGCSAKIQGTDKIASIDGKDYITDDLCEQLTATPTGKLALFSYVLDQLITTQFPASKSMKEEATALINQTLSAYEAQYGEEAESQLQTALASNGYASINDYKNALINSFQYSAFIEEYVKDHYDEVFEDYYKMANPKYISLIKIGMADPDKPTNEEKNKYNEVVKLLKSNKSFGEIAKDYSDDSSGTNKGELGIIDSTIQMNKYYGENVAKAVNDIKEGEVSKEIKEADGIYFVYCSSTDKAKMKKELETVDSTSPLLVYDSYMHYLAYKSYDIEYKDESIQSLIDEVLKESLNARDELRGGKS